jgi:hypothetical protein
MPTCISARPGCPQLIVPGRTPRSRSTKSSEDAPDPTRHRQGSRRSPPSHVIHTVHQIPAARPTRSHQFPQPSLLENGPRNDQVNGPKAQQFYVTTGTPPEATLRDHPNERKGHPNQYKGEQIGSPDRIRTGVSGLKGRRPRPLDDGTGCAEGKVRPERDQPNSFRLDSGPIDCRLLGSEQAWWTCGDLRGSPKRSVHWTEPSTRTRASRDPHECHTSARPRSGGYQRRPRPAGVRPAIRDG